MRKVAERVRKLFFCQRRITDPRLIERLEEIYAGGQVPQPIGTPGFELPVLAQPRLVKPRLAAASWMDENWLVTTQGAANEAIFNRLKFDKGTKGNLVIAGQGSCIPRKIHFQGNNGLVILGQFGTWFSDLDIRLSSDDETLFWGEGASSNGTSIILSGNRTSVIVGNDAMFAAQTVVRTSDLHSIVSLSSGEWLNKPRDVIVEPHAWIGQEAMLLKGSHIGQGAIIAARAVVSSKVDPCVIAAGIPAKVIRQDVSWVRDVVPPDDVLERLSKIGIGGVDTV